MRLIDADALRKVHCEDCNYEEQEMCKSDPICATLMWLDEAPTIEAEPVKHGRWVDNGCYNTCSVCENSIHAWNDDGDLQEFAYCPNCGAKMDEEKDNG